MKRKIFNDGGLISTFIAHRAGIEMKHPYLNWMVVGLNEKAVTEAVPFSTCPDGCEGNYWEEKEKQFEQMIKDVQKEEDDNNQVVIHNDLLYIVNFDEGLISKEDIMKIIKVNEQLNILRVDERNKVYKEWFKDQIHSNITKKT